MPMSPPPACILWIAGFIFWFPGSENHQRLTRAAPHRIYPLPQSPLCSSLFLLPPRARSSHTSPDSISAAISQRIALARVAASGEQLAHAPIDFRAVMARGLATRGEGLGVEELRKLIVFLGKTRRFVELPFHAQRLEPQRLHE
jgi:hypothetical protein